MDSLQEILKRLKKVNKQFELNTKQLITKQQIAIDSSKAVLTVLTFE
jgi:hypothetical protein